MEWLIILDGSSEKLVARTGSYDIVGFFAELESAKAYIGRSFWIRGDPVFLHPGANKPGEIKVKNTQRVTVTRAEWPALTLGTGYTGGPIVLCVKPDTNTKRNSLAELV